MSEEDSHDQLGRDVLHKLWEHHWWSFDRLLAAVRELSDEEFRRELGVNYGSVRGAMAHLVGSELVWLKRAHGESINRLPGTDDMPDIHALVAEWERCRDGWRGILASGDLRRVIRYRTTGGQEYSDPVWFVMTHLVDHSAAYRGVIIAALRLLGRTPPVTGMIFQTREELTRKSRKAIRMACQR